MTVYLCMVSFSVLNYAVHMRNIVVIVVIVGSKYYENEKRKDMQIEDRIKRQKEELDSLTVSQKTMALAKVTPDLTVIQVCCFRGF